MVCMSFSCFFFFQAEDGIRDLVRSRGLGDVYKRQSIAPAPAVKPAAFSARGAPVSPTPFLPTCKMPPVCLLYTSDAADERSSVDLGGRRIITKKHLYNSAR